MKPFKGAGKMRKSVVGAATTCMFVLSLPSFAAGPPNNTNKATKAMSDSVQQTPNTGGVSPEDTTKAHADDSADSAVSAMRASAQSTTRVKSMTKVAFVKIVDLGSSGEGDQKAIETASSENRGDIKKLQDAIQANDSLRAKLEEKSVKPGDVLATKLNDDGSLTVYVNKAAASH
jgi:hypothetical protein